MNMQINDPRIILKEKLLKIGIEKNEAILIALETGSSQAVVDVEYLESNFQFSKKIKTEVLNSVGEFYSGAIYEN